MGVNQMRYDPTTGKLLRAEPPINTRTMLHHLTKPPIVVEGEGGTDAEKLASVAAKIAAKEQEGYSRTIFPGRHPHSKPVGVAAAEPATVSLVGFDPMPLAEEPAPTPRRRRRGAH